MKESPQLTELVTSGIFVSTEAQMLLERRIKGNDGEWSIDFSGVPSLSFDGEAAFTARPHLLGSTDANYGSFRWGWSPDNDWGLPVFELSTVVREFGETHVLPELTDAEFDVTDDQTLRLVIAAKTITGHVFHVPLPVGPTTTWLIIDSDDLALGEPEIRPVVKALAAGLQLTDIHNHRHAIEEYGRLRGFHVVENGEGLRILLSDGSADLTFDELNRLTNCQVHAPLSEEAAEQLASAGPVSSQLEVAEIKGAEEPVVAVEPVGQTPAEAPVAAPAETEPQPQPSKPEPLEEPAATAAKEDEQPKKKKGFFGRLFGR